MGKSDKHRQQRRNEIVKNIKDKFYGAIESVNQGRSPEIALTDISFNFAIKELAHFGDEMTHEQICEMLATTPEQVAVFRKYLQNTVLENDLASISNTQTDMLNAYFQRILNTLDDMGFTGHYDDGLKNIGTSLADIKEIYVKTWTRYGNTEQGPLDAKFQYEQFMSHYKPRPPMLA